MRTAWWPRLADALVLAALVVGAAAALGPAYGGERWWWTVAGGALAGSLTVWVSHVVLRWSAAVTVLALAVVYFLVGPALATPSSAVAGWLPGVEPVRLLTLGVVTSWKQLLTVATPVGTSGALLVPAFLTALVAAAVATRFAAGRRPGWALTGPLLMLVVAAVFGTATASLPMVAAGAVAVGGLIWWAARRGELAGSWRRPLSLVLALAAAGAALALVPGQPDPNRPRLAVRDVVTPPFDPRSFTSPLVGFRNLVGTPQAREAELFTVTGLLAGARLRLAAMDSYDGVVWSVSETTGTFRRVGDTVTEQAAGEPVTAEVEVTGYRGNYLPGVGRLTGIEFEGERRAELTQDFRYSPSQGTGVVTSGVQPGDRYRLTALLAADPADAELAGAVFDTSTGLLPPARIPEAVRSTAERFTAGAANDWSTVAALRDGIVSSGFLSHGGEGERPSNAGHGLDRMIKLFGDPNLVGDQEQYASALSLMLWSQRIPNRVVMGFDRGDSDGGDWTVTGNDAGAWVEVPILGRGWVTVDPTPDDQQTTPRPNPAPAPMPDPQVLQPPPPPPPPARADSDVVENPDADDDQGDDDNADDPAAAAGTQWWHWALWIGLPLLVVAAVVVLLLRAKSVRRRRRRTEGDGADRIAGGWDELRDRVLDLGHRMDPVHTRTEAAARLDTDWGTSTAVLARRAESRVFGPGEPGPDEVEKFWADTDAVLLQVRARHGRWRRWRAALSPRSLLAARRERRQR